MISGAIEPRAFNMTKLNARTNSPLDAVTVLQHAPSVRFGEATAPWLTSSEFRR